MDVAEARVKGIKRGIVLFLALACASTLATIMVYTYARGNLVSRIQDELTSIGKMAVLHVDAGQEAKIIHREQEFTPLYNEQVQRLRKVIQQTREVRYLYTLRRTPTGLKIILDTAEPVDADQDGVNDKSNLFEDFESDPVAMSAFETATPQVTNSPTSDQWGTFWTAYIPIVGEYGEVKSVLGIDMDASRLNHRVEELTEIFCWALILSILACATLAVIFTGQMVDLGGMLESKKTHRAIIRQSVEIGLGVIAVIAICLGAISQTNLAANHSARLVVLDSLSVVSMAQSQLGKALSGEQAGDIGKTSSLLTGTRSPWLGGAFLEALVKEENPSKAPAVKRVARLLQEEATSLTGDLKRLQTEEGALSGVLNKSVAVCVVVSLAVFWLLMYRSRRERVMLNAVKKGQQAESDLGQIVEHLPVGLFTYSEGVINFSNPAWRDMVGSGEDAEVGTFVDRIHYADRTAFETLLQGTGEEHGAVDLQIRVNLNHSRQSHIAIKAIPMKGNESQGHQVLAFALDITESIEARNSLQTKSQEVELKNRMLAAALEDLEANLESVVRCLVRAVEAKDPYTAGHSERVMEYSLWIGEELGLGPYEMRVLELGTLVHDVGKIGIADAILTKPGKLDEEEYKAIKMHPELGVRILEGIGLFHDCMPIVRWHHERLDGSGYPDKLSGESIPFLVRIAAAADVFDAMTSTRAYRSGIEPKIVLKIMEDDAARGVLDPVVIEALERAVDRKGVIPQTEGYPNLQNAA